MTVTRKLDLRGKDERYEITGDLISSTGVKNGKTYIAVRNKPPVVEPPPVEPPPPPPPTGAVAFGSRPLASRMDLTSKADVVIEGKTFKNGTAGLAAIRLTSCQRITIRDCDFIDVPGAIYAYQSTDVVIEGCRYSNITGPAQPRTGANVANFVQFDACDKVTVRKNKGKGGDTEDIVSVYKTKNALIEDNHFEGTNWTSGSGSGIALGDYGGANNIARRNILVNPGQVGAFIAGGTDCQIVDNIIIGQQRLKSNVGVYVWAQGGAACSGHTVSGNRVSWRKADGGGNPYWDGGNCGSVAGTKLPETNNWNENLDIENFRVVL